MRYNSLLPGSPEGGHRWAVLLGIVTRREARVKPSGFPAMTAARAPTVGRGHGPKNDRVIVLVPSAASPAMMVTCAHSKSPKIVR